MFVFSLVSYSCYSLGYFSATSIGFLAGCCTARNNWVIVLWSPITTPLRGGQLRSEFAFGRMLVNGSDLDRIPTISTFFHFKICRMDFIEKIVVVCKIRIQ